MPSVWVSFAPNPLLGRLTLPSEGIGAASGGGYDFAHGCLRQKSEWTDHCFAKGIFQRVVLPLIFVIIGSIKMISLRSINSEAPLFMVILLYIYCSWYYLCTKCLYFLVVLLYAIKKNAIMAIVIISHQLLKPVRIGSFYGT